MIHVFHGFLGSPEDFTFLKSKNVILHDLCEMSSLPDIHPEDTLIGYSMGGRIALEIAQRVEYQIKKIVLINAHPGLSTEEDRIKRVEFENTVLSSLKAKTVEDFFSYWNNLPIFSEDRPLPVIQRDRLDKFISLFDHFRLSKQANHLPQIIKHRDKFLCLVGTKDNKYMNLTSELLIPNGIKVREVPGGHRLFQSSKVLKEVLLEEGIL